MTGRPQAAWTWGRFYVVAPPNPMSGAKISDRDFAMLTMPPGPDIAPYHDRQIVVLPAGAALHWLNLNIAEELIFQPGPLASLVVRRVWPD